MSTDHHLTLARGALLAGRTRTAILHLRRAQADLDVERDLNFELWNRVEARAREQRWEAVARKTSWAIQDAIENYVRGATRIAADAANYLNTIASNQDRTTP